MSDGIDLNEIGGDNSLFAQANKSEKAPKSYTIGDLAKEFGITLRTLRFYEDRALISPKREGVNRLYSRRDRARLKLILMGKKVGFSLDEIREMIDLYDLKDGQVTQLRVALEKFRGQIVHLEKQKGEIEQAIGDLSRTVAIVNGMLAEREGQDGS